MFGQDRRGSDFDTRPKEELSIDKEQIGQQLDIFSERHGLKSLRDRLRIGLNEVAILAFDQTNAKVMEIVAKLTQNKEDADRLYADLVKICVGMQESGPWEYAKGLADPESPEMKLWYMIAGAETIGYERDMDLNDAEFVQNTRRIYGYLESAAQDPTTFFATAKEHLLEQSKKAIRFDEDDTDKRVPIGEGFASFLPMAIKGYEAGVVQDAEGWLFIGARGEISNTLLESVGLKKEVGPDERNPSRTVTYFVNEKGQKVIKKLHPGLLIVLSRSFDLSKSIVRALNDEREAIEVADDALGHTRVVQTTEKNRAKLSMDERTLPKGFMRRPETSPLGDRPSDSQELTRPREEFYTDLFYIRSNYVYIDAFLQLLKKRESEGKEVTDHDKEVLWEKISRKMEQKVDELRYVNGLIADRFDTMSDQIHRVIDMAGGAGDLGLAVTNELLSTGHEVDHTEIVDPQKGVAEFMDTIIDYLPFRQRLKEIAEHNTGYLQDAHITSDSMVVAKHACGTLTDDIISQWRESESPMLVAMTCCQGKAKGESARYGFSQAQWDQLCQESDLTNTTVPDMPGKARDRAVDRLNRGNQAMKTIDTARVEYLRRHGFQAELITTDKFPKGDVIIARRLPKNFMTKLGELQRLESMNPLAFDTLLIKVDILAAGAIPRGFNREEFGDGWTSEDFAELGRRFVAHAFESAEPSKAEESALALDRFAPQKEVLQAVFSDTKGRIDLYVKLQAERAGRTIEPKDFGKLVVAIKTRILRNPQEPPAEIRSGVDAMMVEMGL
jgi:hypothetical protein